MEIPRGGESEQGIQNLFEEIMTENFLNPMKEKVIQAQKVQGISYSLDPNQDTS